MVVIVWVIDLGDFKLGSLEDGSGVVPRDACTSSPTILLTTLASIEILWEGVTYLRCSSYQSSLASRICLSCSCMLAICFISAFVLRPIQYRGIKTGRPHRSLYGRTKFLTFRRRALLLFRFFLSRGPSACK